MRFRMSEVPLYRGTSLIRKRFLLGPYSRATVCPGIYGGPMGDALSSSQWGREGEREEEMETGRN